MTQPGLARPIGDSDGPRQLILEKGPGTEQVRQRFASAATGRADALARIAQTHTSVVETWRESTRASISR